MKCERRQLNDRRDDHLGRAHHQEDGRPHPRGGREGLREEEMMQNFPHGENKNSSKNRYWSAAVYSPSRRSTEMA